MTTTKDQRTKEKKLKDLALATNKKAATINDNK